MKDGVRGGGKVDTAVIGKSDTAPSKVKEGDERSWKARSSTEPEKCGLVFEQPLRSFEAKTHSGSLSSDIRHGGRRQS